MDNRVVSRSSQLPDKRASTLTSEMIQYEPQQAGLYLDRNPQIEVCQQQMFVALLVLLEHHGWAESGLFILIIQGVRLVEAPTQHMLPRLLRQNMENLQSTHWVLKPPSVSNTHHFYSHFIGQSRSHCQAFFPRAQNSKTSCVRKGQVEASANQQVTATISDFAEGSPGFKIYCHHLSHGDLCHRSQNLTSIHWIQVLLHRCFIKQVSFVSNGQT